MRRDLVLRGLAQNPAIPDEGLLRLLRDWPVPVARGLESRAGLPLIVQERMAAHPERQVRAAVARSAWADPAVQDRLLQDPDWRVRMNVYAYKKRRPMSEGALQRLMTELLDPPDDSPMASHELFGELFFADWGRAEVAARHPDPRVRLIAVGQVRPDRLPALQADPDPQVAAAAAAAIAERRRPMQPADLPPMHCHAFWTVLHSPLSPALAAQVAASDDLEAIATIAANPTLPPAVAETLAHHRDAGVRATLAACAGPIAVFVADRDPHVRAAVATRAGLTAEQIAVLAADPDDAVRQALTTHAYVSDAERAILDGQADLRTDEATRWAFSTNPRLRRRAAQDPHLPPPVVAHLATDPDEPVRVELARHHPEAPGELLLSCFLKNRKLSALLERPQFPQAGLAAHAGHPDSRVRALAARDPEADPALIAHLSTDPDPLVRKAMARCPRLPADRLAVLLDDPDLAVDAAANPSLDRAAVITAIRSAG
ncbi:hypothetical protein Aab01nite_53180 [Paractinoplanes abujensis]|uniref:Leucine rich repeat (LRR) protein n=1 Tax=Paractinoplanes abujensis TaxID=882441 RepID=A0A7W7CRW5_9ACTN|nr:hypothetical protein [Actinoplanes abujensis]MBB4693614.1 hypothetical protein [Actinoplanes abujensis]GID21728.1 hypothetical protein Aab01nite_53180 [Actinoplanes abujensis]